MVSTWDKKAGLVLTLLGEANDLQKIEPNAP
jgi:hypothetical protein